MLYFQKTVHYAGTGTYNVILIVCLSALFPTAGVVAERSENSDSAADLSWEVLIRLPTTLLIPRASCIRNNADELSRLVPPKLPDIFHHDHIKQRKLNICLNNRC